MTVTRFAPSPNGLLHYGHAWSAIVAHDLAIEGPGKGCGEEPRKGQAIAGPVIERPIIEEQGRFLLRIEDIDGVRSRPELADEYRRDLEWLGLEWEEVPAQSTRLAEYRAATQRLLDAGLLYRCSCTRAQIAQRAERIGPEGPVYPGTCRKGGYDPDLPFALRLDMERAWARAGPLEWSDAIAGPQLCDPLPFGDVVLFRKDAPASYHLAATLDDATDGVTLVTRGADLFAASHIHRLLQALLGLPVPRWHHHLLLLDENGRKLAKRRGAPSLAHLRQNGVDGHRLADQLRQGILPTGISRGIL